MKTFLNRVVLAVGLLALTACASTFRSDVSTFHELTSPGGERVLVTPIFQENEDSLEFKQYANIVAGHLAQYGYKSTGDNEPELIAGFDVTIDDGREKIFVRPDPFGSFYWQRSFWGHGRFHRGFSHFRGGFGFGNFGAFGRFGHHNGFGAFGGHDLVARTYYTATLKLELRKPDGTIVFEGRAETQTRRKDLPKALPFLAAALFESFPGENGITRRVVIDRGAFSEQAAE